MALQVQGNTGVVAEVDGTGFRALRVTSRPVEYGSLGFYKVSPLSGAIAAGIGGNSEILQIRWTDATRFMLLQKLTARGMRATTAFAAGVIDLTATIARSWSGDGSGGTALTLTGNNAKMRTSMGTTLMGTIRIASTAALGAGTKTFDNNEVGRIVTHSSAGVGSATPIIGSIYLPMIDLFVQDSADEHPFVAAQNEGISVRCTVPGTGVWNIGFDVKWGEVAAY